MYARSIVPVGVALALLSAGGPFSVLAAEQTMKQVDEAHIYRVDVNTHPSQGDVRKVEGAEATLLTTKERAFASFTTHDLTPGNAYTLWFVAINDPAACETSPCGPPDVLERTGETETDVGYAAGLIAGPDGTGRFVVHQPLGAIPQAWFGNDYTNAQGAEIHLVVNDHGPLIEGLEHSMLGSYRGGCTDESLPAPFPDAAKTDGEPVPNSCRLLQSAVFIQDAGE